MIHRKKSCLMIRAGLFGYHSFQIFLKWFTDISYCDIINAIRNVQVIFLEFLYRDILNIPYPNPEIEKDFPDAVLRGAQFAPFAALTGHDEAISETSRQTDEKILLSESQQEELNRVLRYLLERLDEQPNISVTYFVPDTKKQGGAYITKQDALVKFRTTEQKLLLADSTEIFIPMIVSLEILEK